MSDKSDGKTRDRTIPAAVISGIAVVVAAVIGLLGGNAGIAKGYLPGNPVSTVTKTIIRPAATVTVTPRPSSGSSVTGTTSGAAGNSTNLADPANSDLVTRNLNISSTSNVQINGKTFQWGFAGNWCILDPSSICSGDSDPVLDINLSRSYTHFTARIGATDQSLPGASAIVTITSDGTKIFSKTVVLGSSFDVSLPVNNVLTLEVSVSLMHGSMSVALGDPTAVK